MMIHEVVSKLQLFNETAAKLDRRSFVESSRSSGINFSMQINTGIVGERSITGSIGYQGPNEEETDAYILTCRMFVRDGDGISIREIAEYYDSFLPIDRKTIDNIKSIRQNFNDYLDQPSSVVFGGITIPRRDVFEVFLWGRHVHLNEGKKEIYDAWSKTPAFPLLHNNFINVLKQLHQVIISISRINMLVIGSIIASYFWAGDLSTLR